MTAVPTAPSILKKSPVAHIAEFDAIRPNPASNPPPPQKMAIDRNSAAIFLLDHTVMGLERGPLSRITEGIGRTLCNNPPKLTLIHPLKTQ